MTEISVGAFESKLGDVGVDVLLLPVFEAAAGTDSWGDLGGSMAPAVRAALASRAFSGKAKRCLAVRLADGDGPGEVILVGLGKAAELTLAGYRDAIAVGADLGRRRAGASVAVAAHRDLTPAGDYAGAAVEAVILGQYRFEHYKPAAADARRIDAVLVEGGDGVDAAVQRAHTIANATCQARDLVNLAPSDKRPPALADLIAELARAAGLGCEVIDEARAAELKMGALLAVGRGSSVAPRLLVLEHQPEGAHGAPVALVGKGVTFDTGGISIKPAASMHEMKSDMAGGAAVAATMLALAELKVPVHVVGLIPMAENMPDGDAYRPGDLVTAMNGKVIEVLNTDAEGRLILADALAYANERFSPSCMIDLATLTGACVVALGDDVAGVMGNDDALRGALVEAGDAVHERVWPLPMFKDYDELIKSTLGHIKNTGGRAGGAITAAKFLENFVGDTPWAHLDIAGPAFRSKSKPTAPEGGTGFGVRLLLEWLRRRNASHQTSTMGC